MNPEEPEKLPSEIEELKHEGQELVAAVKERSEDSFCATKEYVKKNPWIAVAGALAAGVIIASFLPKRKPVTKVDVLRDWLEENYGKFSSRLPGQGDLQAAVDKAPCFLKGLRKKFNH